MAITTCILVAVAFFALLVACVYGNTCDACDECPFSNVEILHDLIDARINATVATRVEELTAALEVRVESDYNAVNADVGVLNTTVDERMTTVSDTIGVLDTSITKILSSQEGPGKSACRACMHAWCWILPKSS